MWGRIRRQVGLMLATVAVIATVVSCTQSSETGPEPSTSTLETDSTTSTAAPSTTVVVTDDFDDRFDLPPEARESSGGADPRPPSYWMVWNSCAPENRADVAEENGGREAGWVLVDDILADPGVQLGDYVIADCAEAVAILGGSPETSDASSDPGIDLASQLLAAELNLNVGSETCPVAEESVVGANFVLSTAGFDGTPAARLDAETEGAVPELIGLLAAYNTGELCR